MAQWAEWVLRGSFFAKMRAMQRCEKMNADLKKLLNDKIKLYEFVGTFNCHKYPSAL